VGEVILNNFRNDGDYSRYGWTLLALTVLIFGAAYFAGIWIPKVQYEDKVKHGFNNATLEEIADTMVRPSADTMVRPSVLLAL
jgi:hypothetical protein